MLARLYLIASAFVRDAASSTILQFVSTFGVWLLSERSALSPIITVVIYAMTLAQAAPGRLGARLRISSYSVWETAVFVVNDGAVARELSRARVAVMQAALDSLDGETSPAAAMAREKYAAARKVAEDTNAPQAATKYDELRLRAIAAQRTALQRLRERGEF